MGRSRTRPRHRGIARLASPVSPASPAILVLLALLGVLGGIAFPPRAAAAEQAGATQTLRGILRVRISGDQVVGIELETEAGRYVIRVDQASRPLARWDGRRVRIEGVRCEATGAIRVQRFQRLE